MLDSDTVEFIRKYEKAAFVVIALGATSIFFAITVLYNKNEWNNFIFNDYDFQNVSNYSDMIIKFEEYQLKFQNIVKIKKHIEKRNKEQIIYNENLFELVNYNSLIIVIEVHDDTYRLAKLLQSLEKVTAISKAVLIFVHNCYNERINSIIEAIEFTKYMQIFYPYSSQLYPNIFPGNDSRFCSLGYFCHSNNNRRNATLAQKKHFWWWYVRQVFDILEEIRCIENFILFLKYDQIVTEDLLYMLHLLSSSRFHMNVCPECEIIGLGAHHPDIKNYHVNNVDIVIGPFGATETNLGIAFNKSFWNKIKANQDHFCYFNDYRWDESLKYLGTKLPFGEVSMMSTAGPRVLSTECGENSDDNACDAVEAVENVTSFVKQIRRGLFPRDINFKVVNILMNVTAKGYWEDVRDIDLCKFFLTDTYLRLNET